MLTYNPETGEFRLNGKLCKSVNNHGYGRVKIKGKYKALHRLAFELMGEPVPECVDHINGNRTDNRWCNLRPATRQQNAHNRGREVKGYTYIKARGKYRVDIRVSLKTKTIGYFDTEEEARAAYAKAKKDLHSYTDRFFSSCQ